MIRVTCTFVNQVVHDYPNAQSAEVIEGILHIFAGEAKSATLVAGFPIAGVLKWEFLPEAGKIAPTPKK